MVRKLNGGRYENTCSDGAERLSGLQLSVRYPYRPQFAVISSSSYEVSVNITADMCAVK
jgi:hypothetical protein